MATNITEKITELITGKPAHLCGRGSGFSSSHGVFESPVPHYFRITLHLLNFRVTMCRHAHQFRGSHTAEHVKQAIEEMLNAVK